MPRVIITEGAARGLERCRRFLADKDRLAASRAGQAIKAGFSRLAAHPESGRPFPEDEAMRELVIAFGETGYVALYRSEPKKDAEIVLAFRHQKEAGY